MVGLSQSLVEELNEPPCLISVWRAFYEQLFEPLPTLVEFLILLLSESTNLPSTLIDFEHRKKKNLL